MNLVDGLVNRDRKRKEEMQRQKKRHRKRRKDRKWRECKNIDLTLVRIPFTAYKYLKKFYLFNYEFSIFFFYLIEINQVQIKSLIHQLGSSDMY